METFISGNPTYTCDCEVSINDNRISVYYYDENGLQVAYHGEEEGPGHYQLKGSGPEFNGRATLHRFSNGDVLIGDWTVNRHEGLWKITLDE